MYICIYVYKPIIGLKKCLICFFLIWSRVANFGPYSDDTNKIVGFPMRLAILRPPPRSFRSFRSSGTYGFGRPAPSPVFSKICLRHPQPQVPRHRFAVSQREFLLLQRILFVPGPEIFFYSGLFLIWYAFLQDLQSHSKDLLSFLEPQ